MQVAKFRINRHREPEWYGRVTIGYKPNGDPIQTTVVGSTEKEYYQNAKAKEVDASRGPVPQGGPMKLRALIDRWLAVKYRELAPQTVNVYKREMDSYVPGWLASMPLRSLDPSTMERWLDGLSTDKLRSRIKARLSSCLNYGVRMKLLTDNPLAAIRLRAAPATEKARWSPDDARRFLMEAQDSIYEPYWTLGIRLGLRPSEIEGLTWDDIDFTKRTLTVGRTRSYVQGRYYDSDGKNPQAHNPLPLRPNVLAALKAAKARQDARRAANPATWRDTGYVVVTTEGGNVDRNNARREMKKLCKLMDIDCVGLYGMRHTCGSLLHEDGADLKTIAAILRHKSIRTTANVYLHPRQSQLAAALDSLDASLEEPGNEPVFQAV